MRFSKVRQLLANFQFIPSSSLDFQVGLNLDETTPLSNHTSVDAVFQLMHKRHVSLAQLVQVLDEMQRFDTLSVLSEAGFPYHPELHPNFSGTLYTFKQNLKRREHPKFLL